MKHLNLFQSWGQFLQVKNSLIKPWVIHVKDASDSMEIPDSLTQYSCIFNPDIPDLPEQPDIVIKYEFNGNIYDTKEEAEQALIDEEKVIKYYVQYTSGGSYYDELTDVYNEIINNDNLKYQRYGSSIFEMVESIYEIDNNVTSDINAAKNLLWSAESKQLYTFDSYEFDNVEKYFDDELEGFYNFNFTSDFYTEAEALQYVMGNYVESKTKYYYNGNPYDTVDEVLSAGNWSASINNNFNEHPELDMSGFIDEVQVEYQVPGEQLPEGQFIRVFYGSGDVEYFTTIQDVIDYAKNNPDTFEFYDCNNADEIEEYISNNLDRIEIFHIELDEQGEITTSEVVGYANSLELNSTLTTTQYKVSINGKEIGTYIYKGSISYWNNDNPIWDDADENKQTAYKAVYDYFITNKNDIDPEVFAQYIAHYEYTIENTDDWSSDFEDKIFYSYDSAREYLEEHTPSIEPSTVYHSTYTDTDTYYSSEEELKEHITLTDYFGDITSTSITVIKIDNDYYTDSEFSNLNDSIMSPYLVGDAEIVYKASSNYYNESELQTWLEDAAILNSVIYNESGTIIWMDNSVQEQELYDKFLSDNIKEIEVEE